MAPPAQKRRRRGADVTYHTIGNNTYILPVHRHVSVASTQQSVVFQASAVSAANPAPPSGPVDDTGTPIRRDGADAPPDEASVLDNEAFEMIPPEFFDNINDMLEFVDRPRNRTASDNPLEDWRQHHIDEWLAELLRLEGRCGLLDEACASCHEGRAEYRCDDCNDLQLYCQECAVERHLCNPFHRLQFWSGTCFQRTTLKRMGLRVQLGHPPGVRCHNPVKAFANDFIILDVSGMNEVALDYCGCETAQAKSIQLLRSRLVPATGVDPKTAATFRLMEFYHLLHNQSKVSGFEFYNTLVRRTDNTGTVEIKSRYTSFMRMARMWYHLKLLKRFGRGHDPCGVKATTPGSCAVLCPACPQVGINLPADWATAPPEQSWLYRLFIGMDANFRLKRKKVSSDSADPGFNNGIAYFVEEHAYKDHINKHGKHDIEETSTCSNHDAVKLANMRGHQDLAGSCINYSDYNQRVLHKLQ